MLFKCLEKFNGQNLVMLKAHWQGCRGMGVWHQVLGVVSSGGDLEILWGRFLKDMVIIKGGRWCRAWKWGTSSHW